MMKKWIREIWRRQPRWLQRTELSMLNRILGRSLDPQRILSTGDVVVGGFHGTATGLGQTARQMLLRFQSSGIPALPSNISRFALMEDFEAGPLWPANTSLGGIAIFHINPDMFALVMAAIGKHKLQQRRIIGYWAWELETVPSSWIRTLSHVDEVWVPSHFIANALKKVAPLKAVRVVPPPLDITTTPRNDLLPAYRDRPIVLFMYDVRSVHARKNPEAVIEAFRRATQNNPEPVLVLKVNNAHVWPEANARLERAIAGMSNVHIMHEKLSVEGVGDLLARADVVMSLHRSEGFGLLMAEAMAAGKPVIATAWSGNLDFMTHDCSILIDYDLIPIVDPQHVYDKYDTIWAEPNIEQAAHALQCLLKDPGERQRLGQAARTHIAEYLSSKSWIEALPHSFWQAIDNEATPSVIKQKRQLSVN